MQSVPRLVVDSVIYSIYTSAAKGASHLHAGEIKYNEHRHVKHTFIVGLLDLSGV